MRPLRRRSLACQPCTDAADRRSTCRYGTFAARAALRRAVGRPACRQRTSGVGNRHSSPARRQRLRSSSACTPSGSHPPRRSPSCRRSGEHHPGLLQDLPAEAALLVLTVLEATAGQHHAPVGGPDQEEPAVGVGDQPPDRRAVRAGRVGRPEPGRPVDGGLDVRQRHLLTRPQQGPIGGPTMRVPKSAASATTSSSSRGAPASDSRRSTSTKNRSNPAGEQITSIRSSSSPTRARAWGAPLGTITKSPGPSSRRSSPTTNTPRPLRT